MMQSATSHPCPPLPALDHPTTRYNGRLAPSSVLFTVKRLDKRSSGHQDRARCVAPAIGGAFPSVFKTASWLILAPGNCLSARKLP